jgi:hypothetical protein
MTNNAIAWAHFQLRGGLKGSLWFCGLYALAVIGFYIFAHNADPRGAGMPSGWTSMLLAIQTLSLVIFASSRISAAIRGDITSRMIESHRLMPTSPAMAIAGYLVGGASQPLMISATTFLLGLIISTTAGLQVDRWILSNAVLLLFAGFVWSMIALGSFISTAKGPMGMGWIFGVFGVTAFSQGMITIVLPAATILVSPLIGRSIFTSGAGTAMPSLGYAASLVGQLVIGSLFFTAASRRYRSAELTGFTPAMALGLIITWTALSIFGILNWEELHPSVFSRRTQFGNDLIIIQATLSIGATTFLSLLPLAASSRFYRDWKLHQALNDPGLARRPIHPALVVLVCALACTSIAFCIGEPLINPLGRDYVFERLHLSKRVAAILSTALTVAAFLFSVSYIMRILHRGNARRTTWLIGLFIVFIVATPLIAEVVRNVISDMNNFKWSRMAGVSPVGAIILTWGGGEADPAPGILMQIAIAALLAILFHSTGKGNAHAPAAPLPA